MKLEQYAMAAMTALINTTDFLHGEEDRFIEVSIDDTHTHMSHGDGPVLTVHSFSLEGHEEKRKYFRERTRQERVVKMSFRYAKAMMEEQSEQYNSTKTRHETN